MKKFLEHINHKNPNFQCFDCNDELETLNLNVPVSHIKNGSPSQDELNKLRKLSKNGNEEIVEFYSTMNGIKMYCQGNQPKIEIFPIHKLDDENEAWQYDYEGMESNELYDFQKEGMAFGEISQSGNYFVFYQRRVYYADHDGWEKTILGNSFFDFLNEMIKDPCKFMYDRGCYSRFEDGKTNKQWIPKLYKSE